MNVRMPNPNLHTIDPPKQHLPESRNVMWNNEVTLADFRLRRSISTEAIRHDLGEIGVESTA